MTIVYVLKAYPRLSESFILNEILLLEAHGVKLEIIALKGHTDPTTASVVAGIRAPVRYLNEDTTTDDAPLGRWLRRNLWRHLRTHGPLLRRRPGRYLTALIYANAGLAFQVGLDGRARWKRAPLKDFLRGASIAARTIDENLPHYHAHFCHGATTMGMLAAHLTGRTYSFTAHAKDIYLPKLNPAGLLGTKIKRAAFVVTCTAANAGHLRNLRPSEHSRIHAVPHGLDITAFGPPPCARPVRARPVILSVGRQVPKKGFDTLLRAAALLRDRNHAFELVLLGPAGPETRQLHDLVDELGLQGIVTFEGPTSQAELASRYAAADIFVLACRIAADGDRDGIPNVLAEAMATELPVVATTVSGIPEIVRDGETGLLVEPDRPPALADALALLLDSPDERRRLGRAARGHIRASFDSAKTIEPLIELFRSVDPSLTAPASEPMPHSQAVA